MMVLHLGGAKAGQVADEPHDVARRLIQMGQARIPKAEEAAPPKARAGKGK